MAMGCINLSLSYCCCFLLFFISCCLVSSSGTLVGFSIDARRNSKSALPAATTLSFLKQNKVSPSQIRVFVAEPKNFNALLNTRIPIDLYINLSVFENQAISKDLAISWLNTHFHPNLNITSIMVSTSSTNLVEQKRLSLLIPTLNSLNSALKCLKLEKKVKVSVVFQLSVLEKLRKQYKRELGRVLRLIQKYRSFVMVEIVVGGELSMGDQFIGLVTKSALCAANVIHGKDVSMVLNIKSSVIPSDIEVAEFSEKVMKSLGSHSHIKDKVSGLFAEIHPIEEFKQNELNREEEQIFHSSHRELLLHEDITDITPFTPITFPTVNPTTPTIVTVPSTNPVTVMPTNPTAIPVPVPSTNPLPTMTPINPVTTPITVPATNPLVPGITTPVTVPVTPPMDNPITNPLPPPVNVPVTNPVTTPVTTNPVTSPVTTTPVTNNPPTNPISGQSWCVAKTGAPVSTLQAALDYACGINPTACSAIQSSGNCYNPNTLQSHASYAFNSYYQKNPVPTSCDFGGAAMLVNANPSTGSCVFQSSTSSLPSSTPTPIPVSTPSPIPISTATPVPVPMPASTSPPSTFTPDGGVGGGTSYDTPPTALNSSYPTSPMTNMFGSQPPPGDNTLAPSVASGLQPLSTLITLATSFVIGKLLLA
ncbi:hypothetical protein C5167_017205 [Papaver somniferum]|uniref:X8 domain-containing protein n=1 Tax=Papaver somniferum TaxID=3469 RepID=A0A4Y7IMS1_PAPSO|nr:uncharacterized protein LOC113347022 [Papaver somniferum]RZC48779.1 hypothetical protein C5167_017205 [Papaver somniferum]